MGASRVFAICLSLSSIGLIYYWYIPSLGRHVLWKQLSQDSPRILHCAYSMDSSACSKQSSLLNEEQQQSAPAANATWAAAAANSTRASADEKLTGASSTWANSTGVPSTWGNPTGASAQATSSSCPAFFQWIHHDLAPWKRAGGITQQNVEQAKHKAAFRVLVVDGKLYSQEYYKCFQCRSTFTLWGLLMLLERFPGKIPDVDLMFNCVDRPAIKRMDYNNSTSSPPSPAQRRKNRRKGSSSSSPPALFSFCTNKESFDIPFPDWSYWGWPEINIATWEEESREIFQGSKGIEWKDRHPVAYWKGNPHVAKLRKDLLTCRSTKERDFGTAIYVQDWLRESQRGFKNSKLSKQCDYRYKIYAEGNTWSVSFKYIMACGSTMLNIDPRYYDFFMRGLIPNFHYLPIGRDIGRLCSSIQHAVQWGNSHPSEAEAIGKHGQEFLRKELTMDHVYSYMFHLLQEYAKLQRFKPRVLAEAQLLSRNTIKNLADQTQKEFLNRIPPPTLPTLYTPCVMPHLNEDVVQDSLVYPT